MLVVRNKTVDIIRGIGIISIVIGHLGINAFTRVTFSFHIPVFYIISGFYLKEKSTATYFSQKIRTLLIPYVVTCLMVIILSGFMSIFSGSESFSVMQQWILASLYGAGSDYKIPVAPIGAIWFLWASFWGGLFLQIGLRWKEPFRFLWILFLFFFGWISSQKTFWYPLSIQAGCCATLYMYVGFCTKQYSEKLKAIPTKYKNLFRLLSTLVWFYFIYSFRSFYLVRNDFGRGLIDIIGSLCGCYCVYLISSFIDKRLEIPSKILSYLGRYSIIVLCVHLTEMNLIDWWKVVDWFENYGLSSTMGMILAVIMKLILIFGFTILLSKNKQTRRLFGIS